MEILFTNWSQNSRTLTNFCIFSFCSAKVELNEPTFCGGEAKGRAGANITSFVQSKFEFSNIQCTTQELASNCSRRMGTTQANCVVNSAKTKSVYLKGEKRKNVKICFEARSFIN